MTYLASVMTLLVIPFAPGIFGQDLNLGLLYFFAIGGLSVVGLLMAGWSSYNKYSLLGGLRSAAQVVSYEIPLTLSVVGLILLAGTMSLNHIAEQQAGWFTDWYVFRQPLGFLIFFIAATAEANRTPFDLTEADSEIVAGFATEYSGMRFGFFFFAEYVNVFIISALTVTLFLGGWNAPFPWPWPVELVAQPGPLGIGLLILFAIVPLILTLALRGPDLDRQRSGSRPGRRCSAASSWPTSFGRRGHRALAYLGLDWVAGLLWFLGKTYAFVFIFVWMRGTLPRVRIDQLMDFAWKWLLPASLLNLFVTAGAIVVFDQLRGPDEHRPGSRHREGHGPDPAPLLRAQGHGHVPGGPARPAAQVPRPAAAALRRVGHAQVRDLLPVRPGLPDRVHRHGRDRHARPLPRPLGRARDVRRAARGIGPAPLGPDRPRSRPTGRSRAVDLAAVDGILEEYDHDPAHMLQILEATQAAYGYLPVAALKRISQMTGAWYAMIYGTASYYGHLRFEPAEATAQATAMDAHRPPETTYLGALDAALPGAPAPRRTAARRSRRAGAGLTDDDRPQDPGRLADRPPRAGRPRDATDPTDLDAASAGGRVRRRSGA